MEGGFFVAQHLPQWKVSGSRTGPVIAPTAVEEVVAMATNSTLRASDAEREQVVSLLSDHMATGRLDPAEFEERMTSAYAARTRGELDALLTDLPTRETPPARPRRAVTVAARRSGPYANWLLTGVICLVIWAATSVAAGEALYFWPVWVIGPWGVMLLTGRRCVARG